MTLMEEARKGRCTEVMKAAARGEDLTAEEIRKGLAAGEIVIPHNRRHEKESQVAIGQGLTTKINANLGTSEDRCNLETEMAKLDAAVAAGAHAVMDLSTGDGIKDMRQAVLEKCPVPVGTVPLYQVAVEVSAAGRALVKMKADDIFSVIEEQCRQGVDFITVHCGLTREAVNHLREEGRLCNIVSRGGSITAGWMLHNEQENPLYEHYDRLLELAREYDVTLSLGDGMRPGCLADSTDRAQIQELLVLGELVDRARKAGVQAMVEGPGHVRFDQIETNIRLEKELCSGAPFYVLGPLVTDSAPGYDHITAAIGGTMAAYSGADFLCYVTPAEHLGLPDVEDVREGVIASRIAAHAADLALGHSKARARDNKMAAARRDLDWERQLELALDPEKATAYRQNRSREEEETCSMCGSYCAVKIAGEALA
ncbi:MAG: phosphomethylpyrimidine synthase ThiC [Halanaerobiales bacterium]